MDFINIFPIIMILFFVLLVLLFINVIFISFLLGGFVFEIKITVFFTLLAIAINGLFLLSKNFFLGFLALLLSFFLLKILIDFSNRLRKRIALFIKKDSKQKTIVEISD